LRVLEGVAELDGVLDAVEVTVMVGVIVPVLCWVFVDVPVEVTVPVWVDTGELVTLPVIDEDLVLVIEAVEVCVKDNDGVIDGDEPKPTCKMQL
jgi:hypothetical protein